MTDATDDLEDQEMYRDAEEVKEKESLMSYCNDILSLDMLTPTQIIEIISDYLEENNKESNE